MNSADNSYRYGPTVRMLSVMLVISVAIACGSAWLASGDEDDTKAHHILGVIEVSADTTVWLHWAGAAFGVFIGAFSILIFVVYRGEQVAFVAYETISELKTSGRNGGRKLKIIHSAGEALLDERYLSQPDDLDKITRTLRKRMDSSKRSDGEISGE